VNVRRLRWLALCAVWLTGCAGQGPIPYQPMAPNAQAGKIDLFVELQLTERFQSTALDAVLQRQYKWLLGDALSQHAETMARMLFRDVVVTRPGAAPTDRPVQAILTPSAQAFFIAPMIAFTSATVTVALNWELATPTGKTIWSDQIGGKVTEVWGVGYTWNSNLGEALGTATREAFGKSAQVMSNAPQIRAFAADPGPGVDR